MILNIEERLDEILPELYLEAFMHGSTSIEKDASTPIGEAKQAILALMDEARAGEAVYIDSILSDHNDPYGESMTENYEGQRLVHNRIAQLTKSETMKLKELEEV